MEWGAPTPERAAEAVNWLWEPLPGNAHCRGVNTTHCTTESEECEQEHAKHAQMRDGPMVCRGACAAFRAVVEPVRELAASGYSALRAGSSWTMTKLGTWAEWTAAAARPLAQACTQARECVDLIGLTHWMACTEATRAMPRRRVRSMSPWRDRRHERNAR